MTRKIETKSFYQWCVENKKKDLLKEWDYSKNSFSPKEVSFASHKEAWWKCAKCGNEWSTTIKNRKSGTGCRKCSYKTIAYKNTKVKKEKSLKYIFPKIAKEWDYSKNNFDPNLISAYSEKKVWWICSKGHSYNQKIYQRTANKSGCPYCGSHKVLKGFNDLQTLKPELAKEWNYKRNGDLKPQDVLPNSNKKVWWLCSEGHEWFATINNRNHLNRGCPYCSGSKPIIGKTDLKTVNPKLAKEWNYKRNGDLKPQDVLPNSNKKVWWICPEGHEWKAQITNRNLRNNKCPICSNQKILPGYNDLFTTNPKLKKEWDYIKNKINPENYSNGSGAKVWWICPKGHSYQSSIHNKTTGYGCPYCANQKVLKGYNDLSTTNPKLAKEWDYKKNGDLKPSNVIAGSKRKVWWICKNKHSYKSPIVMRNRGTGCPVCNKSNKTSFPEQAVYFYIKKEFPDAINGYKNKTIFGNNMELDIYIPSIKVGIEYDGRVFHNKERLVKDNKKYEICRKNKIVLIRIEEFSNTNVFRNCDHKIEIKPSDKEWLNYAINKLCFYLGKNMIPDVEKDRNEIFSLLEKRKTNLLEKNPQIAAEWDYRKNKPLVPENVSPSLNIEVWWKCSKGHSWKSSIRYRTSKNSMCPTCSKYKLPRYAKTTLDKYRPDVAEFWDNRRNLPYTPSSVAGKSKFEYWFVCDKCGYSWKEPIKNITKRKHICPKCKDKTNN